MDLEEQSAVPCQGEFFTARGAAEFFYRFKGSRLEHHGGAVGKAVQARRCLWDDDHEALNEIDGPEEWVRVESVQRIYDRDEVDEAARDVYLSRLGQAE